MPNFPRIPTAAARKLGYYVYVYVNPLDDKIFYVGKGKGSRALAHVDAKQKKAVARIIKSIRAAGKEPAIDILAAALADEETAFRVEAAVIDALRLEHLANRVRGWGSRRFGRLPWADAVAQHTRKAANIRERAILIRISDEYRYSMTPAELYDVTRSAWKLGPRREEADYAFAVFEGVVREVYLITGWHKGGTTFNTRFNGRKYGRAGRWEFVGTLADDSIRRRYLNRYVGERFKPGSQNPISYVNVPHQSRRAVSSA